MTWVKRNLTGAISGVFANQQPGFADEQLADDDPQVVAFLNPPIDPIGSWDVISLKLTFNHENRIRSLEGRPQVTIEQFKTFVRSQL